MSDIDDIDRRILNALQQDASKSLEDLGAEVGLSRNACWRRIKALEDRGIVTGRVALVDPSAIGLGLTVFIQVRCAEHSADWMQRFSRAISTLPQITGVYRMTGDLDYLIRAQVADVADYDRLYQQLTAKIEMGDVSASFVMERMKDTTALPA